MKLLKTSMVCIVFLAGFGATSSTVAQQNRLHGLWVGGHPASEGYVMVRMRIGLDNPADDRRALIDIQASPDSNCRLR